MKKLLYIILCFTLVGFALLIPLVQLMNQMEGPRVVTELDRNGVINEDAVKQHYPQLADNIRYKLGSYVTRSHEKWLFTFVIAGAVTNALAVLAIFLERRSKAILPQKDELNTNRV